MDEATYTAQDIYARLEWLRNNKPPVDDLEADGLNLWMDRGADLIKSFAACHDAAGGSGEIALEMGWIGHSAQDLNEVVLHWLAIAVIDINEFIEMSNADTRLPKSPGEYWDEYTPRFIGDRDGSDSDAACRMIDVATIFAEHCPEEDVERIGSDLLTHLHIAYLWMLPKTFGKTFTLIYQRTARMMSATEWALQDALAGALQRYGVVPHYEGTPGLSAEE